MKPKKMLFLKKKIKKSPLKMIKIFEINFQKFRSNRDVAKILTFTLILES